MARTGYAGAVAGVVIAAAGSVAGCGGLNGGPTALSTPARTSIAHPPVHSGSTPYRPWVYNGRAPAGVDAVQLDVVGNPAVGEYVSGPSGHTLYRFDLDSADPSTAHCVDECAGKWPALTVRADQLVYTGKLGPSVVGYVQRADGTYQVTIQGWPVYYFLRDETPGDVRGQNVDHAWSAVTPPGIRPGF
jgi:predicted lipoprotein with Yx(FWY)xxD motif